MSTPIMQSRQIAIKASWELSNLTSSSDSQLSSISGQCIDAPTERCVPDGVNLVCTSGTTPSKLVVSHQSTVYMQGGKLMGTEKDKMSCNMNCAKMVIAGAIIGAILAAIAIAVVAAAGVLTGGGAWVAIGIGAAAGAGGAMAGAGAGKLLSMMPCICALLSDSTWSQTNSTVKIQGIPILTESSRLGCFFGGQVMIFFSEEAAKERAEVNATQMKGDLALVILSGALLGATAAGAGGFVFGGRVALSAGGGKALGAYLAGGITNLVGGYAVSWGLGAVKSLAYQHIPVSEEYFLQDYQDGSVINETIKNKILTEYFDKSANESLGSVFNEVQQEITNKPGLDAGSAGGIYAGANRPDYWGGGGIWDSDAFIRMATNPSFSGYANYLKSQLLGGAKGSLQFRGAQNRGNVISWGLDFGMDGVNMLRSKFIKDEIEEFAETIITKEVEAKDKIHVLQGKV